ncbi:MAG: hypothetical protein HY681_00360 [Chloroflexi bacterium]|nr:hypothetical protein [Chloroflexota bacterium]
MGKADRMLLLAVASVAAFIAGSWAMDYALLIMIAGLLATLVMRLRKTHAELGATSPSPHGEGKGSGG